MPLPRSTSSLTLSLHGKMGNDSIESWNKSKLQGYSENNFLKDLNRIDRQPVELEWKIFPGFTTVGIFNKIQRMMEQLQWEPENLTGRIIFMSMCNDTVWDSKGNNEMYEKNSKTIQQYVPSRSLVFPGAWI